MALTEEERCATCGSGDPRVTDVAGDECGDPYHACTWDDDQPISGQMTTIRSNSVTQAADPDFVNAVVRGDVPGVMPVCVVVFCDRCGTEHSGDYLVRESASTGERHEVARRHMREQGWACDERGDLCPACLAESKSR